MATTLFVVAAASIFTLAESACTKAGDDCLKTKCCADPKMKCFRKNQYWASCKNMCDPEKVDADDGSTWTCEALQANVSSRCSPSGQECTKSTCCQDKAFKCFEKNEYFASCSKSCTPGSGGDPEVWSCKVRKNKCTEAGADCSKTGCCQRGDMKCFRKNEYWASCKTACDASVPDADDGKTWKCDEITEEQGATGKQNAAPAAAPAPSTTPAPTFIIDNSGLKRPVFYGP